MPFYDTIEITLHFSSFEIMYYLSRLKFIIDLEQFN